MPSDTQSNIDVIHKLSDLVVMTKDALLNIMPKFWIGSDDEPCSNLDLLLNHAEVGAAECCYYGYVIDKDGNRYNAPGELNDQDSLMRWCESKISDLIISEMVKVQ